MLPVDVLADLGKVGGYLIFVLIGAGFGVSLELAGFGDSRRLAAQFYLKDMTVLKTMFTGIIVACLLIFLSSAIGILDFAQLNVNQTFLWPGIVGGLIMGVGFIVGGYCPGTSLIATASFKLDGLFFVIGAVVGTGIFGESLPLFDDFWNSSFSDRYLLSDWLGLSLGATVFAVTLLAVAFFYGAEKIEEFFRTKDTGEAFSWKISKRAYQVGAAALIVISLAIWFIGQPDPIRKWELMKEKYEPQLVSGEVNVSPLEYVKTNHEASIKLVTLDLRPSEEFKAFRLNGSENITMDDVLNADFASQLVKLPAQGVVVLVSNDKSEVEKAWQYLKVQGVANLYILDNGLNDWNKLFGDKLVHGHPVDLSAPPAEILELFPEDAYIPKIKMSTKKHAGGLCG